MVLIIEQEVSLQTLLNVNLRARGYQTVVISDINEAFEEILKASPHLIILDAVFNQEPVWAFLQELADYAEIPVILTTTTPQHIERAAQYDNVKEVLVKPFDVEKLMALLQRNGCPHSRTSM